MSEEKTTKTPLTLNRGKLELKPSAGVQNRSGLVVEVRKKRVFHPSTMSQTPAERDAAQAHKLKLLKEAMKLEEQKAKERAEQEAKRQAEKEAAEAAEQETPAQPAAVVEETPAPEEKKPAFVKDVKKKREEEDEDDPPVLPVRAQYLNGAFGRLRPIYGV